MKDLRALRSRFVAAHGERKVERAEALALFWCARALSAAAAARAAEAEERAARACCVRDRLLLAIGRPGSVAEAREIMKARAVASLAVAQAAAAAVRSTEATDRALEAATMAAALCRGIDPYEASGDEDEAEAWRLAEARARATVEAAGGGAAAAGGGAHLASFGSRVTTDQGGEAPEAGSMCGQGSDPSRGVVDFHPALVGRKREES